MSASATTVSAENSGWNCALAVDGKTWVCRGDDAHLPGESDSPVLADRPAAETSALPSTTSAPAEPVPPARIPRVRHSWIAAATTLPSDDEDESLDLKDIYFEQLVGHLESDPWATCQVRQTPVDINFSALRDQRTQSPTNVTADFAEIVDQQTTLFRGDVSFSRADQILTADQVTHFKQSARVEARGDVYYRELGLSAHGQSAIMHLDDNRGTFDDVQFVLDQSPARGSASQIRILNPQQTEFDQVTYTTCEPGKTDWQLEAETLNIDDETGLGVARNVWVEFKDTPIFYTPYVSFPIDDRRMSGFLVPSFGNSDDRGFELITPYYWNIAPNYDATLIPRYMTDRGLMLGGQFRYLTPSSNGEVAAEWLPNDQETDESRGQISYQHMTRFNRQLTAEMDLNLLSDDEYLEDFGDSLDAGSNRHVHSEALLRYQGSGWSLLGKVENYDTIDDAIASVDRPHRRLPQILHTLRPMPIGGGTEFDMRNEYVYFDHSADTRGSRVDIQPGISLPIRRAAGFITPRASLRHTQYALDNEAAGIDDSASRTLPILSLDSGLYFDRENAFGGFEQTLEPRLFYLYVPHDDQDEIPLFDTSEYDFGFTQLFRENRFSGADRQSDANQLTLAVTTRLLEPSTGIERLRASIGSIVYLDKPEVTLRPNQTPVEDDTSAVVGELNTQFTEHWQFRSALKYDPHQSMTDRASAGIHFRDGNQRILNLSYRTRQDIARQVEQTDVSYKWPLSQTWSTIGRWNYSLEYDRTLEAFLGVEKDTCCWRFRILARRYLNDALDEEPNDSIMFQLELKGLSSFGAKLESFLQDGILGYREPE